VPEVAIVISPVQSQPLPEFVSAVADELARQGVPCTTHAAFPEPRRGLVYLAISPRDYLRAHGPDALPEPAILRRTVFLGAEDLSDPDRTHLPALRDAGAVFDIAQPGVVRLHREGVPARLLRPGYVEAWDRFDPAAPRPIDIMFYGTRSPRREAELASAADVLARHGCVVHLADEGPHPADSPTWLALGRWPLLASSKLAISLHRGRDHGLEWLRAVDAMHCGAVLLTEHAHGLAPFAAGEHLLVSSPAALAHVAEAALRDEVRLQRIRVAAHDRLRGWLPLSASVAVLRAALLELVARPVAAGQFLGIGRDAPAGEPLAGGPDDDGIAAVRQELSEVRHELGRLRATLRAANGAADRVRFLHRSAAWHARRGASVSVLLVAGDDPAALTDTLESVAGDRLRDIELIAVVRELGGMADGVRRWAAAHPRTAVTIVTGGGRGLGAARNLALELARAPFCLVVEPGQTLAPRGLSDLRSALAGDPAIGFVYPIQVAGDRLANALGWEPRRPGTRDAILPPVLLRTEALRGVGGYRDDADDLDGDLWRRLAAGGHEGRVVPQLLARAA
jgi:hypothetical protein